MLRLFNSKTKKETDDINEELSNQVEESTDRGKFTVKLEEALQTTSSEISGHKNTANSKVKRPLWTEKLKIMRKRTNALRRRSTNVKQRGAKRE